MLAALTAGCATPGSSGSSSEATSPAPILQQIAATATGDFATSLRDAEQSRLLTVVAEPLLSAGQPLILNLTQQAAEAAPRRFRLLINASTEAPYPLNGMLAPLNANGQVIAQCPLTVRTSAQGLSATTQAESCRFGEGAEQIGLVKEFLFAGDQIRIADRLFEVGSGQVAAGPVSDLALRFYRLTQYEGWMGVLEGDNWRIARGLEIDTANGRIEPVDAAGMSLGVIIELDRTELDEQNQPILRLSVLDAQTESTLARTWGDPGARRIGLALPELQVGLERRSD